MAGDCLGSYRRYHSAVGLGWICLLLCFATAEWLLSSVLSCCNLVSVLCRIYRIREEDRCQTVNFDHSKNWDNTYILQMRRPLAYILDSSGASPSITVLNDTNVFTRSAPSSRLNAIRGVGS